MRTRSELGLNAEIWPKSYAEVVRRSSILGWQQFASTHYDIILLQHGRRPPTWRL